MQFVHHEKTKSIHALTGRTTDMWWDMEINVFDTGNVKYQTCFSNSVTWNQPTEIESYKL